MGENKKISRREIVSLKTKAALRRTPIQIMADWLAGIFGTITFLILNAVWFLLWIVFNSGIIADIKPFDPFPFTLLTTTVSLEAIFLSIIVLISQNRAAKVDDLREEIDLELNTISEQEITKIMEMLAKIMEHNHLNTSRDSVLKEMLKPIKREEIEEELNRQM